VWRLKDDRTAAGIKCLQKSTELVDNRPQMT
jgi:hypothetical protein